MTNILSIINFDILSIIKPFANVDDILKPCFEFEFVEKDQIIICVGENDKNPIKLQNELSCAIRVLNKCNIIVIDIIHNRYLNVDKLNYSLRNLCKNHTNCEYLFIRNRENLSRTEYLSNLCNMINLTIDSRYYKEYFIKSVKLHLTRAV